MSNLQYKIEFHTFWHCGSGLAAGADVDALTVKDRDGLPFVPGKSIKGLVREAVEELLLIGNGGTMPDDKRSLFMQCFGNSADRNVAPSATEGDENAYKALRKGDTFFSNAELKPQERKAIVDEELARFMYSNIATTALTDGVAKEHTLRKVEVAVPCTLHGEIIDIPEGLESDIKDALKYIKRLGQSRNRGLGRCSIEEIK